MQSLQDQALTVLFEQYLINKLPTDTTKKLMVNYLSENSSIMDEYLEKKPIYGVYCRGSILPNTIYHVELIRNFASFSGAREWVIKNGKKIVNGQEYYYETEMALTIIEMKPKESISLELLSSKLYPTFVFTEKAYKMILEEHRKLYLRRCIDNPVIHWIYFVKDDRTINRGCSWEHVMNVVYFSGRAGIFPSAGFFPNLDDNEILREAETEFKSFNGFQDIEKI